MSLSFASLYVLTKDGSVRMVVGVAQLITGSSDSSKDLLSNGGASFTTDINGCLDNVCFNVEESIDQCDKARARWHPECDAISGH